METEHPTGQAEQQTDTAMETEPTAPPPSKSPEKGEDAARFARIERLLERIVEHMYQVRREEQTREFGLGDIFAALAQVLAIAAMLGGVLALLKTQPDRGLAHLSLMGAVAMQGLALTLFMLKRRR